jgi:hypothetical protein
MKRFFAAHLKHKLILSNDLASIRQAYKLNLWFFIDEMYHTRRTFSSQKENSCSWWTLSTIFQASVKSFYDMFVPKYRITRIKLGLQGWWMTATRIEPWRFGTLKAVFEKKFKRKTSREENMWKMFVNISENSVKLPWISRVLAYKHRRFRDLDSPWIMVPTLRREDLVKWPFITVL